MQSVWPVLLKESTEAQAGMRVPPPETVSRQEVGSRSQEQYPTAAELCESLRGGFDQFLGSRESICLYSHICD